MSTSRSSQEHIFIPRNLTVHLFLAYRKTELILNDLRFYLLFNFSFCFYVKCAHHKTLSFFFNGFLTCKLCFLEAVLFYNLKYPLHQPSCIFFFKVKRVRGLSLFETGNLNYNGYHLFLQESSYEIKSNVLEQNQLNLLVFQSHLDHPPGDRKSPPVHKTTPTQR